MVMPYLKMLEHDYIGFGVVGQVGSGWRLRPVLVLGSKETRLRVLGRPD